MFSKGEGTMTIRTVGVLGCGLMGSGIAHVCAVTGYRTIVREVDETALESGLARLRASLDAGVARGKLTAEARDAAWQRVTGTVDVDRLVACDLVIEAIVEDLAQKRAVYVALAPVVDSRAVLVSNTSSLCITELGTASGRPEQFAGLHFFSPVPAMKLVEVIRGLQTSDETFALVFAFAQSLGKDPITAPDRPGFIVNRLLVPYLLDAIRAYQHGLGTAEDIDKAMVLGCGHPMGPLALLDFVGLDTVLSVANIMFDEFREPAYAPPPLLRRMVLAGHLGRKSGRGFYDYSKRP
jgi:3-hydroxybutyryl-CoA dehydrogenase